MANDANDAPSPSSTRKRRRERNVPFQEMQAHLIEQATRLFEQSGFGTSVRVLFEQANITPPTLYRLFDDKDDLINAVVQAWGQDFQTWMAGVLEGPEEEPGTADDRLVRLFTELELRQKEHGWSGSLAANAAAALPASHPVNKVIAEHRKQVRTRLRTIAVEAGVADPNDVARRLQVLLDGAMAGASMEHGPGPIRAARSAINSALRMDDPA
jgi:AcrR family transcriptional regulator